MLKKIALLKKWDKFLLFISFQVSSQAKLVDHQNEEFILQLKLFYTVERYLQSNIQNSSTSSSFVQICFYENFISQQYQKRGRQRHDIFRDSEHLKHVGNIQKHALELEKSRIDEIHGCQVSISIDMRTARFKRSSPARVDPLQKTITERYPNKIRVVNHPQRTINHVGNHVHAVTDAKTTYKNCVILLHKQNMRTRPQPLLVNKYMYVTIRIENKIEQDTSLETMPTQYYVYIFLCLLMSSIYTSFGL